MEREVVEQQEVGGQQDLGVGLCAGPSSTGGGAAGPCRSNARNANNVSKANNAINTINASNASNAGNARAFSPKLHIPIGPISPISSLLMGH